MSGSSGKSEQESTSPKSYEDFGISPFYWEQNNPSALIKTYHGHLDILGEEYTGVSFDNPVDRTDFEREILNTAAEIHAFRFFAADGEHFGCMNLTNAECSHFELLKDMYGPLLYLVLENKMLNKSDPRKKRRRHVIFFDEYTLCLLNERYFTSADRYLGLISLNKDTPTTFEKLQAKMFRNGFCISESTPTGYAASKYPTPEQYYSNKNREKLDSSDLISLLWKVIADSHIKDADKRFDDVLEAPLAVANFAHLIYNCAIVGFGWMPCLLAKKNLNELDRFVLEEFSGKKDKDGINTFAWLSKLRTSKKSEDEDALMAYGSQKILIMEKWVSKKESKIIRLPLRKVLSVDRYAGYDTEKVIDAYGREYDLGDGNYEIVDVDGNKYEVNHIDLKSKNEKQRVLDFSDNAQSVTVQDCWTDGQLLSHNQISDGYIMTGTNSVHPKLTWVNSNGQIDWSKIMTRYPIPAYTYGTNTSLLASKGTTT